MEDRLKRHLEGRAKATKYRRPLQLVYKEEFQDRKSALKREKQLKSYKSHQYLEKLIDSYEGV